MSWHFRAPCILLAVAFCSTLAPTPPARADGGDTWVGKEILMRRPGVRIVPAPRSDEQKPVATLTDLVHYFVEGEKGGYVQVRHEGALGWLPKADAVPLNQAFDFFTNQILKEPKDARPYTCRALVLAFAGEHDRSIADSTEALRLDPRYVPARLARSQGLCGKGQFEKALADCDEAIRLDPASPQALAFRGVVRMGMHDGDKALADFDRALQLAPRYAGVLMNRGYVRGVQGDFDKAFADLGEATRLAPRDPGGFACRGCLWVGRRNFDKALADFDEALRLNPTNAQALSSRGAIWAFKHESEKALADMTRYVHLRPKDPGGFANRGHVWLQAREYAKALADYEEALRLAPEFSQALYGRASIWSACPDAKYRDGKRAVESARRACVLTDWGNPWAVTALAAAYAEVGDFAQAVKFQSLALSFPDFARNDGEEGRRSLKLFEAGKPCRLE